MTFTPTVQKIIAKLTAEKLAKIVTDHAKTKSKGSEK